MNIKRSKYHGIITVADRLLIDPEQKKLNSYEIKSMILNWKSVDTLKVQ